MPIAPYKIVVSDRGASPLVVHIPHASVRIPPPTESSDRRSASMS